MGREGSQKMRTLDQVTVMGNRSSIPLGNSGRQHRTYFGVVKVPPHNKKKGSWGAYPKR